MKRAFELLRHPAVSLKKNPGRIRLNKDPNQQRNTVHLSKPCEVLRTLSISASSGLKAPVKRTFPRRWNSCVHSSVLKNSTGAVPSLTENDSPNSTRAYYRDDIPHNNQAWSIPGLCMRCAPEGSCIFPLLSPARSCPNNLNTRRTIDTAVCEGRKRSISSGGGTDPEGGILGDFGRRKKIMRRGVAQTFANV